MPIFPPSKLFLGPSHTIVVYGPHIQVLNTATGDLISSVQNESRSGPVRCAVVDTSHEYIATSGDDKKLKIWQVSDGLKLLNERELPKKATEIQFTGDSQTILVSDKFGDVFSYPLRPQPSTTPPAPPQKSSLSSHENPSSGTLVLGHTSLLTSFLLSPCEKYIITADRDEHIRVSWFPQGYNIERFCLGHTKFVSAIHIPKFDEKRLVSGGGDKMLKGWDWMTGVAKWEIDIWDSVEPFVKVRAEKRRRVDADEEVGDEGKGKRSGRRKGKGKALSPDEEELMREDSEPAEPPSDSTSKEDESLGRLVLVLHKIDTLDSSHGKRILFSAIGATALFSCAYPTSDELQQEDADVKHFDFGRPVIEFDVDEEGRIWVLLDAEWGSVEVEDLRVVRALKFDGRELAEVEGDSIAPLLGSLNSKCLLAATPSDLKALDLYGYLTSMPKNSEVEFNAMDRDLSEGGSVRTQGSGAQRKQLSKKELGRLRKKRELAEMGAAKGGDDELPLKRKKGSEPESESEPEPEPEIAREVVI